MTALLEHLREARLVNTPIYGVTIVAYDVSTINNGLRHSFHCKDTTPTPFRDVVIEITEYDTASACLI